MPQNGSSTFSPMTEQQQTADGAQQHDFEAQKQVHQQIRNDPDYDDWEYGTEPLPHEAWTAKVSKG
ncbi:hypothetical protein KUL97_07935 [Synechococcus sp. HK05]|nr:hypothetical protein [Synechococcus sp. HK05]